MWALRRAYTPLRSQGVRIRTLYCCSELEMRNAFMEDKLCALYYSHYMSRRHLLSQRFCYNKGFSSKFYCRFLSSQPGAESNGEEDDSETGFLNDESKNPNDVWVESDDDFILHPELPPGENAEDDIEVSFQNVSDLSETEEDVSDKPKSQKKTTSELFNAIVRSPSLSVDKVLDKWAKDGNDFSRGEISLTVINLRKRGMFGRALQLSEWLEANKRQDFLERDYASRVDLICKVRGLYKAENFMMKIPQNFRGELIYRTLLANCCAANNLKKAEEVCKKMNELEFPVSAFSCNHMLILYKRHDKKKMADVLLLMEKENVKPSQFTYQILIDTKGQSNDLTGMEQVVETMKAEGMEPDVKIKAILARHYATGGLKAKAQAVLKDIEGGDLKENRWVCKILLPLYAEIQMSDEVERVWRVCEANPTNHESLAAIVAWGKLKNITEAEAVFDRMSKRWKRLSASQYGTMLKVYSEHKMLSKGKDIIKLMVNDGCKIGPLTWDSLVKLYINAGEVEKADSILHKAAKNNQRLPWYTSYMAILDQYAKRGDVHNTEKTFYRLRMAGYGVRFRHFETLLQAYVKAKVPAYGMRERMKADNLFPNKAMAAQLAQVDESRKSGVSDLLD